MISFGCAHLQTAGVEIGRSPTKGEGAIQSSLEAPARQLLMVLGEGKGNSQASLYFLEAGEGGWQLRQGPLPATVGRKGFAAPGEKREGDGTTPSGLFPLEFVFGYAPSVASAMPYRQATGNDIWVDDPECPDYNCWVRKGTTTAASFEEMKLSGPTYRHGIVIGYNRNPVVRGMGSAIFLHVWRDQGMSTAGCVALDEAELVRIIRTLDPAKKPMILMGDRDFLAQAVALTVTEAAAFPPPDLPPLGGGELERAEGVGSKSPAGESPTAETPASETPAVEIPAGESPAVGRPASGHTATPPDLEAEIRRKLAADAEPLVEYRGPAGFFAMAVPIPKAVEQEMHAKKTWRVGCPVPIGDLSYLALVHWGFDDKPHIGELVMHRKLAQATVEAFADLYALRFPIEKMELIERYDGDDHRSMEANNTSAFNCRDVSGRPGVFSNHSYGSAMDINPVQNPYVVPKNEVLRALGWKGVEEKAGFLEKLGYSKGGAVESFCSKELANCKISPPTGAPYLARTKPAPGLMVHGPVVKAFTSRGFQWGGIWRNELDYQHFDVKPAKLR